MRLGFDAKRAFSNETGLGNYSRDTIRILSSFFSQNKYFLYTPKKIKSPRTFFIEEKENIFVRTPESLINKTLRSYWRSFSIVKDIFTNNIDIFHGLSNELPIGIEKTSIKSIVTIHDLIFIRYPSLFKSIDRRIYYNKSKSACLRANKIIAVSEQTKKDIIDYFKISEKKIEVVYQGCNKIFQKQLTIESKNYVNKKYFLPKSYLLYVGTIEERKNLLTLLKALREIPDQKLVVIGNGKEYMIKCKKYISENNLEKRVIFISNLLLEEMAAIYQSAEIMIYPSIFEGFGIPILEALFSKTPVITSKGGCFSEAGGPHSMYVNPLNEKEIENAIIKISKSQLIKEKMINEGFSYAQKFTDKNIATNLIKVYKDLK